MSPHLSLNTSAVIRYTRHISSPEDRITSIKHCAPRISSKMATIDEFVLKNIGLWWRYGISRHYDEWTYIIIGRIFESKIILIPPSLKISESSSNGSYRNTDEVWWRYGISRSCDEWRYDILRNVICCSVDTKVLFPPQFQLIFYSLIYLSIFQCRNVIFWFCLSIQYKNLRFSVPVSVFIC